MTTKVIIVSLSLIIVINSASASNKKNGGSPEPTTSAVPRGLFGHLFNVHRIYEPGFQSDVNDARDEVHTKTISANAKLALDPSTYKSPNFDAAKTYTDTVKKILSSFSFHQQRAADMRYKDPRNRNIAMSSFGHYDKSLSEYDTAIRDQGEQIHHFIGKQITDLKDATHKLVNTLQANNRSSEVVEQMVFLEKLTHHWIEILPELAEMGIGKIDGFLPYLTPAMHEVTSAKLKLIKHYLEHEGEVLIFGDSSPIANKTILEEMISQARSADHEDWSTAQGYLTEEARIEIATRDARLPVFEEDKPPKLEDLELVLGSKPLNKLRIATGNESLNIDALEALNKAHAAAKQKAEMDMLEIKRMHDELKAVVATHRKLVKQTSHDVFMPHMAGVIHTHLQRYSANMNQSNTAKIRIGGEQSSNGGSDTDVKTSRDTLNIYQGGTKLADISLERLADSSQALSFEFANHSNPFEERLGKIDVVHPTLVNVISDFVNGLSPAANDTSFAVVSAIKEHLASLSTNQNE